MLTSEPPYFLTPNKSNHLNSKFWEKPKFLKHICYTSVTGLIKLQVGLPVLQLPTLLLKALFGFCFSEGFGLQESSLLCTV